MGYTVDTTRGEGSFAERSHIYISVGVGFGVLVFDPPIPPRLLPACDLKLANWNCSILASSFF